MIDNTIAAISTAQGEGGISVIRISGKDAFEIADKIFKGLNNKKLADMKGYTASFGKIYSNGEEIDAIRVYYITPKSILNNTGEYLKAKYHVSAVNSDYFGYQYDNETSNGQDGYAGIIGRSIDRIQIKLE